MKEKKIDLSSMNVSLLKVNLPREFEVCIVKRQSALMSTNKEVALKELEEQMKHAPRIEPGSAVWVDHIDRGLICCHLFNNAAPGRMLIISEQFYGEVLAPTGHLINHPDRWKQYGMFVAKIIANCVGIYGRLKGLGSNNRLRR